MKARVTKVLGALLVAVLLLVALAQSALAGVSFCDADLGPMATVAEDGNAAAAAKAEALVVTVPTVAVSVDKGGDNPHK